MLPKTNFGKHDTFHSSAVDQEKQRCCNDTHLHSTACSELYHYDSIRHVMTNQHDELTAILNCLLLVAHMSSRGIIPHRVVS